MSSLSRQDWHFDMLRYQFIGILFWLCSSCGQESLVSCKENESNNQCVEQTPDEKAVIALNDGDFERARTLLEKLIVDNPNEYFRYPRLAAVYAAQAGFDLLSAASLDSNDDNGQSDFLDSVGKFLPSPLNYSKQEYQTYIEKMNKAKQTLLLMPSDHRQKGEKFYGSGAQFQLTLYSSALSVMLLNQFAPTGDTALDEKRLEEMTVDDAVQIITSLKDAALNSAATNPQISEKINSVLAKVDEKEGASDEEKLRAYLEERKNNG